MVGVAFAAGLMLAVFLLTAALLAVMFHFAASDEDAFAAWLKGV